MGDTADVLPDASFDIVYSISVIEHVPTVQLETVFADMARVLRPGGRMIHLIDSYIEDRDCANDDARGRARHYGKVFQTDRFAPRGKVMAGDDIYFRGAYATNSDLVMHVWNSMAPTLKDLRTRAQACSFVLDAERL